MTGVPAGWRPCGRRTCEGLPPHEHIQVPFPPELITHRWAATHHESVDIARIHVDWRAVAYEAMTGRRLPPPMGQLTIDYEEPAHG